MQDSDPRYRFLVVGAVFLIGTLGGWFLPGNTAAAVTCVLGGVAIGVILLLPELHGIGTVKLGPGGLKIDWILKDQRPLETVQPNVITNSTSKELAIAECDKGREIIKIHATGGNVDFQKTLNHFEEAVELDKNYWEPINNIANIALLHGDLRSTYLRAERARVEHSTDPLAFANFALIMASAIEGNIGKDDKAKKRKYGRIIELYEEALDHKSDDMEARKSLLKTLISIGAGKRRVSDCLKEGLKLHGFREEMISVLERDKDLGKAFFSEYPELKEMLYPAG